MKLTNKKVAFTFNDGSSVYDRLLALAERGNKTFTRSLHPGVENILGLRVPDLRNLAREIASGDYESYLSSHGTYYMEERMLHGMVLAAIPVGDCTEYLSRVARFVSEINSWSVCDTFDFSGKSRFVTANNGEVHDFLLHYIDSEYEYEVRFAVVMLMAHYLGSDTWRETVDILERVSHQGYYVKMAVAWALSVAFVRYPSEMMLRLDGSTFDAEIMRMTVRKIRDSRRVSSEAKNASLRLLLKESIKPMK